MTPITGTNYEGATCVLVDAKGVEVELNQVVSDKFQEDWTITGGRPPHNAHSDGYVYADHVAELYPRTFHVGVLDMKWVVRR